MTRRRLCGATVLVAVLLSAGALTACSGAQNNNQGGGTTTTTQETSPSTPKSGTNSASMYRANLVALNDSGVTGMATVKVDGNSITVNVVAQGVTAGQPHILDIHGEQDGSSVQTPPTNQSIDEQTAEQSYGPQILELTPTPVARGSSSTLVYRKTIQNAQQTFPLDVRAIVIHGMVQDGSYNGDLPVAVGLLAPISGMGGGGGSSNSTGSGGGGKGGTGGMGGKESSGTTSGN